MTKQRSLSKVLIYSHDTYGLGHLRRNLVVARELLSRDRSCQVVLASGSPVIDQVPRPAGLQCVQLPPVVKVGDDDYRAFGSSMDISLVRRARTAVMLDVLSRWKPDVLLVDHSPQGMKGELLPVLDQISTISPRTRTVLGLRDILDDPARVRATWREAKIYETLEDSYDRILVYGEKRMFDIAEEYAIAEPVASRLEYCGYVTGDRPVHSLRPDGLATGVDYVLGTVGGGGDGVDVLIATAHAASRAGLAAVLCTGPLMSDVDHVILENETASLPNAIIVEHLPDMVAVAAGARCVVSRGGYNSLCELVNLKVPTIVVPRVWPRREQLLRALVFASQGLVTLVDASHGNLVAGLESAFSAVAIPGVHSSKFIDFQGRSRVAAALTRVINDDSSNEEVSDFDVMGVSA